jgi:ribonuclease ZC3H12
MPKSKKDGVLAKADKKRLSKMESEGKLILTPSRRSDGALWSTVDCNEEDYIVRYAAKHQAVIVSTRKFATYAEPELQDQVENRVLNYTYSEKEFDPPSDPMGKTGPSLELFLHFPPNSQQAQVLDAADAEQNELFKRSIIIDGSNAGYAFTNNTRFDARGIEKCVQYFKERGHNVRAYMAESMLSKREVSDYDKKRLKKLLNEGILDVTPSRRTAGQSFDCYEDDYIIRNAIKRSAIILSNDNFLDLVARSPEYREQIEQRVLHFNFIDGDLWLPADPLAVPGRRGPSLASLLHAPLTVEEELNTYLQPEDFPGPDLQPACPHPEIPPDIQVNNTAPLN